MAAEIAEDWIVEDSQIPSEPVAGRIESVAPREQAGAQTGEAYEFQYAEAALACLELLSTEGASCVYCEWHDDFVVERTATGPKYEFFQVKSRSGSEGPWTMTKFLGVKGPRPRTSGAQQGRRASVGKRRPLQLAAKVGIAERLLDHQRRFPGACAVFAMVTNQDVKEDRFHDLMDGAREAALQGDGPETLAQDAREVFEELVSVYQQRNADVTVGDVWTFLSRLRITPAKARVGDVSVAIGLMGQRIWKLAEVDLTVSEQERIARQLLDTVRAKSHRVLDANSLPCVKEVREKKAVAADDVLRLLALSPSGFRTLKAGGLDDVRELSRLHRLCKESGMTGPMIERACALRIRWEEWQTAHRDGLSESVFAMMSERALSMLEALRANNGGNAFAALQTEALSLVRELGERRDVPTLTEDEVVGLVFAMAAAEE